MGPRGDGQKGDGVLDVRASSCRSSTGHWLCCSNAGGRHGVLGAAPSTGADPVPWGCRVVCTRTPVLALPLGLLGRTATHRALHAALGRLQPSGMMFWECCLEEMEQNAPRLSALLPWPAVPARVGSHRTPLIPHRHVGWVNDQQHRIPAEGGPAQGNLQSFAKKDQETPPLYGLSSSYPLPTAQGSRDGLLGAGGCPSPPAPSCSRVLTCLHSRSRLPRGAAPLSLPWRQL